MVTTPADTAQEIRRVLNEAMESARSGNHYAAAVLYLEIARRSKTAYWHQMALANMPRDGSEAS